MMKVYETGVLYRSEEMNILPSGMYLALFHGRDSPGEELNGWGFEGPVIGPLQWVHTTYRSTVRFCPVNTCDVGNYDVDGIELTFNTDLVEYDGKFYGDYTVFQHKQRRTNDMLEARKLWEELGNTPVNDDGEIEEKFLNFPIGTDREEIWNWFESKFNLSVAKHLMYNLT